MREDMDKVIVERPRLGRSWATAKGYHKAWQTTPADEWPHREGIGKLRGKTKSFNEHLSPLRRFLRSNLGRSWNSVFSEICRHLRQDSVIQSHVRDHLWDYVVRNVVESDGELLYGEGWLRGQPLVASRREKFYVCPRTGILKEVPRTERRTPDVVRCSRHRYYRRLRGVWFELLLRDVPSEEAIDCCFDAWLSRPVKSIPIAELRRLHGERAKGGAAYVHAVRRVPAAKGRQLSKQARATRSDPR